MKCPFCNSAQSEVLETRDSEDLTTTRRRRECLKCGKRFTTYERIEATPLVVIKKNGKREQFDAQKLKKGLIRACEKTEVALEQIEELVEDLERELRKKESAEIESRRIGLLVANRLKKINKIAYIRFASVFKRFVEVEELDKELKKLL